MMAAVIESDYVITCLRQLCDVTSSSSCNWFFLVLVTFCQIITDYYTAVCRLQQEMRAVQRNRTMPCKIRYRNVQRHRAVLPAIARHLVRLSSNLVDGFRADTNTGTTVCLWHFVPLSSPQCFVHIFVAPSGERRHNCDSQLSPRPIRLRQDCYLNRINFSRYYNALRNNLLLAGLNSVLLFPHL